MIATQILDTRKSTATAGGPQALTLAAGALQQALRQQAELLAAATDDQYAAQPRLGESCVGSHVRHCLDHVRALLMGYESGVVNYDDRERGTMIESHRATAFAAIQEILVRLGDWAQAAFDEPLAVRSMVAADDAFCLTESSVARELLFVLSHTIHHNAMIAASAKAVGLEIPEGFGYASSTVAYRNRCVRSQS